MTFLFRKDFRITGTFKTSMSLCLHHSPSLSTDIFITAPQCQIEMRGFYWGIFLWQGLYVNKAALEFTLQPKLPSNLQNPPASASEQWSCQHEPLTSCRWSVNINQNTGFTQLLFSPNAFVCKSVSILFGAIASHEWICVPPTAIQTQSPQGNGLLSSLPPPHCPWQSLNVLHHQHFCPSGIGILLESCGEQPLGVGFSR